MQTQCDLGYVLYPETQGLRIQYMPKDRPMMIGSKFGKSMSFLLIRPVLFKHRLVSSYLRTGWL